MRFEEYWPGVSEEKSVRDVNGQTDGQSTDGK